MERNYNIYLKGMEKANNEKLFFLQHIDIGNFNTIIDFGCGKADVLKKCGEINTHASLIGIDTDSYMKKIASLNLSSVSNPNRTITIKDKLSKEMLNEKTLIIFNSVLHEVNDYAKTLLDALNGTGCTIAIRDMCNYCQDQLSKVDLSKLIKNSNSKILSDFTRKYGLSTRKQMLHYLLKYTYVDNWDLELEEDYFSFDFDNLSLITDKILYQKNYVLEYKVSQIKKDFDIDISSDTTHIQLIIKVKGDSKEC